MDDELRTERVLASLLVLLTLLGFARQYPSDPHEPWLIPLEELPVLNAEAGEGDEAQLRALVNGGRMDVNRVTAAELQVIPGIGPSLAQRIVDYRDSVGGISEVQNLQNVQGIGERTLRNMSPYLAVGSRHNSEPSVAPTR